MVKPPDHGKALFRLFPLPPKPDLSILSWEWLEWLGGWLVFQALKKMTSC